MNPTKVIELLKQKQFLRVIKVCEFELNLKQTDINDFLQGGD